MGRNSRSFILFNSVNTAVDIAAAVNSLLLREGITQGTLAARARVSQPTVSRAARGEALRRGRARDRLLAYLRSEGTAADPDVAFAAIREIWDGSDAHAAALAHLVRASKALWPDLQGRDG
jgi:transcriptional regulator with XRE-family HTH domain